MFFRAHVACLSFYVFARACSSPHPNLTPIPVRENISYIEFYTDYASKSLPVIISGATLHWPAHQWSTDYISALCGKQPISRECDEWDNQVKVWNQSLVGDEWGALQTVNLTTESITILDDVLNQQKAGKPLYLHDQSIDILCPALFDDIRVPRYFPTDYMSQMPKPYRMVHGCKSDHGNPGHPSLFMGPGGSQSGLHADTIASRFWMAVLHGTKRFRLIDQKWAMEYPDKMYPTESLGQNLPKGGYLSFFEVDAFEPDFERHPNFADVEVFYGNVTAGDVIFIPQKWLHQVRNVDYTIAISYNYVDVHNLDDHINWQFYRMARGKRENATASEKEDMDDAIQTLKAMSVHQHFPVNYVPDHHRGDEPWGHFFKRQMIDRFEGFDMERYVELLVNETEDLAVNDYDPVVTDADNVTRHELYQEVCTSETTLIADGNNETQLLQIKLDAAKRLVNELERQLRFKGQIQYQRENKRRVVFQAAARETWAAVNKTEVEAAAEEEEEAATDIEADKIIQSGELEVESTLKTNDEAPTPALIPEAVETAGKEYEFTGVTEEGSKVNAEHADGEAGEDAGETEDDELRDEDEL